MNSGRKNPRSASKAAPTEVLALVAANVLLSKATLAPLRLTCQATRLAVDEGIQDLTIPEEAMEDLRAMENPLTSGLTSLSIEEVSSSRLGVFNASLIASRNSKSLEYMDLLFYRDAKRQYSDLLAALGVCESWPKLRRLTIRALPNVFKRYIRIDSMPALTYLSLNGEVSALDLTALSRGRHFSSTVKVLHLKCDIVAKEGCGAISDGLRDLLSVASSLQYLTLNVSQLENLEF